ncbi:S-layer homology domain-containing protein [Paenibacillus sp. NFR01]|uniref:S-layer homology domain-containing protein n=1 Tax=Paenibacillus sp. NFR01 TaxID=1566279 RepID=UPI0015871AF9|nr:S-layer homology domain-containing protein [Paenibacillus sp. NFR01]
MSVTGNHDFGSKTAGYVAIDPYSVTVSNEGAEASGELTVELSGNDASSFTLSKTDISSIAIEGNDSFTVAPNTGLAVKTYSAAVTVSGTNVTSKSFTVSFEVTADTDAGLASVAGLTDPDPAGGDGTTAGTPVTWTVNVANTVSSLGLADIAASDADARVELYTYSDFATGKITGSSSISLTAGGATTAYIKVTAGDGTTAKYYAVTMNRAAGPVFGYTVNGTPYAWQDRTLAVTGDVLEITADDSPLSPVLIHVTASEGSTVTLKGKAGKSYSNVYVQVDNPVTLRLDNFNITAPAGDSNDGISFKANTPGNYVIEVTGSNTIEGYRGIYSRSNHQLTITGSGTLTANGRKADNAASNSGSGIFMESDKTIGNTNPVAQLTIGGSVTVNATGGDSVGASGGNGIALDWGNLVIESGSVTVTGGKTDGDRSALSAGAGVTYEGGAGIFLEGYDSGGKAGKLMMLGGTLTAAGGEAKSIYDRGNFFGGGRGIRAYDSMEISGGNVTLIGGASESQIGGDGLFTAQLQVSGQATSLTATGGNGGFSNGGGVFVTNDIVVDGARVSATGGHGITGGYGIYSPSGALMIKGKAEVTATGGTGLVTNASGGMAVRISGNIEITGSSKVVAKGGAGQINGSHGLFSDAGTILIGDGSDVTALGGKGDSGVGGVGLRANGNGNGGTVVIANGAEDIYVRGGQGASATRTSVFAKDVQIATGNIGPIFTEILANPRSIKNKSGGVNVNLLTVTTNPPQATVVHSEVEVNKGESDSYIYHYVAPTHDDGLAYMWLPAGKQTVEAADYEMGSPKVNDKDTATAELRRLPPIAHLAHNGVTVDFTSIQGAIDAATDGDTVTINAGTFREQLEITKNITLQGQGIGVTTIESPNAGQLSKAGWKTLKDQWIYAVIRVKAAEEPTPQPFASTAGADNNKKVVIQDLTVDGRKQGYISAHDGIADVYTFNGIAVRDTSALIDHVRVVDVRDTYSDYSGLPVAPLPASYVSQDQPSGANHNESILLEGAAETGQHEVTVQNSQIVRFHKTGILAWGPTLKVDIHDNEIQGHGRTLYSTGNGIQISSTDRSSSGGANGDRRGTTGSVTHNRIYDFGLVIPAPGNEGSYLNLGLYGPTGILLYEAGDGFAVEGNTLTGPGIPAWHNSTTSNDGGYSNDGIGFTSVKDPVIRNNMVSGFGTGIVEGGAVTKATVEGNTLGNNDIDIWTLSGNDLISLTQGAETIAYNQTNNGIDTITGFGAGDRLRVIGFVEGTVNGMIGTPANAIMVTDTNGASVINGYSDAHPVIDFTGGTVTAGDGENVAPRSVEVSVSGGVTTLFMDTENDADAPELTVRLNGIYTPANFKLNGGYIEYAAIPSPELPSGNGSNTAEASVDVLVKAENAGKAVTTESGGVKTTTVTIDPARLQAKLDAEGQGAVVTIPVLSAANAVVGELNGQMVKNMEQRDAVIILQSAKASYRLPAGEINIDAISAKLGGNVPLADIKLQVIISETTADMTQTAAKAALNGDLTLIAPPVDFKVNGSYGAQTVEVSKFNAYVERTIALPDGIDPNRITTGIVVDPDGTVRHVPTKVTVQGGKYYATLNSLTNSTYSVVWHPLSFADVANHWAKDVVNDMGSRLVAHGISETMFNPDADITRAEFAAIIVRGLGLRLGEGANPFGDVAADAWYAGAVQTAASYGLITGFDDGSFRPNVKITREQAMVILAKAMKLTGLAQSAGTLNTTDALSKFTDGGQAAQWSRDSIAQAAQAGLVNGRNGGKLEAKANVTRAEVAVLIQRLLKKSNLI